MDGWYAGKVVVRSVQLVIVADTALQDRMRFAREAAVVAVHLDIQQGSCSLVQRKRANFLLEGSFQRLLLGYMLQNALSRVSPTNLLNVYHPHSRWTFSAA